MAKMLFMSIYPVVRSLCESKTVRLRSPSLKLKPRDLLWAEIENAFNSNIQYVCSLVQVNKKDLAPKCRLIIQLSHLLCRVKWIPLYSVTEIFQADIKY